MDFAVGVLYSTQAFMELVKKTPLSTSEFPQIWDTFQVANAYNILATAQSCEWVALSPYGKLVVTQAGEAILRERSSEGRLRLQLRDMIIVGQPPWGSLLSRGRKEAAQLLPRDVNQCLREALLMDGEDTATVEWWDELARGARLQKQDANMRTGRLGERLSIDFEMRRVGRRPIWQALDSNRAGFDVLSEYGREDTRKLRVEVKASDATPRAATFYVTKNEWNVATITGDYAFHLWALRPTPELRIVWPVELAAHIPQDCGRGEWEIVEIPYEPLWDRIPPRGDLSPDAASAS